MGKADARTIPTFRGNCGVRIKNIMRTANEHSGWSKSLLGCVAALAFLSVPHLHAEDVTPGPTSTTTRTTTTITRTSSATTASYDEQCMDDNLHMRFGIP